MKKLLFLLLIFAATYSYAQKEQRYVVVPMKFYKFKKVDIYGLSSTTNRLFAKAGYKVLTDNQASWTEDLKANPCTILYTETNDISPLIGASKVEIIVKDCYQRELARSIGKANNSDGQKALQTAVERAFAELTKDNNFAKLYSKNPVEKSEKKITKAKTSPKVVITPQKTQKKIVAQANQTPTIGKTLQFQWKRNPPQGIEGFYLAQGKSYYILQHAADAFTLGFSDTTSKDAVATLKKTSSPDIFKVFWKDGTQDIGYKKGNQLLLEHTVAAENQILKLEKQKRDAQ